MYIFVLGFLVLTFLYHILVTTVGYGIFGGHFPNMPALLRDGLWFGVVGIFALWNLRSTIATIKTSRKLWLSVAILFLFSIILSHFLGKDLSDILIGIKYGFLYLLIFLSAQVASSKLSDQQRHKLLKWGLRIAVAVVIAGFLRQGAKLIWPDFFFHIGYGRLDDFHFGAHPPIYYLTGLGGTLRRQGLFAGPNNYGYFLVAFLPLLLSALRADWIDAKRRRRIVGWGVLGIWMLAIALTLSRSAYIGTLVVFGLTYRSWIKRHRKWALSAVIILLGALVGLSMLKGASTMAHITAKLSSLGFMIAHPLGLGLGSSGPAIHHNGNILPENYFIQLVIDIGWGGFILRLAVMWQFLKKRTSSLSSPFVIGFVALLVMGIFLHVFEDSMVNYAFFMLWGVVLTFQSKKI